MVGVESSRGRIASRWVLNAAGAWAPGLSSRIGVDLPIKPRAPQMIATEKAAPMLKPVVGCIGRNLSLKQMPQGQFVVGGGWPGIPDLEADRALTKRGSPNASATDVTAIFPPTRELAVVRVWNGPEAQCVDAMPILGTIDGLEGYVVATGFSGHGFALGPYVGLLMAELMTTGKPSHPLDELSFRRFATFDPERIRQFMGVEITEAKKQKVDA